MPYVSRGQFRLDESATCTFDAAGAGTSFIQPTGARESWRVSFITVNSSSVTLVPVVMFYRGSIAPSNFVAGSFSGTLDVDSLPNISLRSGERLIAVWTGGDVGATGTFRVEGTKVLV